MYRRTLLSLCGGGRSLPGSRYADQVLRRFTLGSVLRCEKSTPDDGAAKPPGETEDKISEPVKEEASVSSKKDSLLDLISGMKVEVSSKRKFQAIKEKRMKQQNLAERQPIESASKMFQMVAEEVQPEEETAVSSELEAAASAVASAFPKQKNQVESELLRQLRIHKEMAEAQRKVEHNISTVLSGMKIVKNRSTKAARRDKNTELISGDPTRSRLNIGSRLMIFPVPAVTEKPTETGLSPNLWDLELAKEIASICEQPPRNGFEEMIQWTKEGKLWTFPIDNEVGLDEEQKVEFYEHVFLDKYLEDFPKQGPIRHFMELVICGLSKNPYLTVQQKKDHIDWYKDYFQQKEDLLRECEI